METETYYEVALYYKTSLETKEPHVVEAFDSTLEEAMTRIAGAIDQGELVGSKVVEIQRKTVRQNGTTCLVDIK